MGDLGRDLEEIRNDILEQFQRTMHTGHVDYDCKACGKTMVRAIGNSIFGHSINTLDLMVLADHLQSCSDWQTLDDEFPPKTPPPERN